MHEWLLFHIVENIVGKEKLLALHNCSLSPNVFKSHLLHEASTWNLLEVSETTLSGKGLNCFYISYICFSLIEICLGFYRDNFTLHACQFVLKIPSSKYIYRNISKCLLFLLRSK